MVFWKRLSTANRVLLLVVGVGLLTAAYVMPKSRFDPNFLWSLIQQQCVPHQKQTGTPAPCEKVELEPDGIHGDVIYKDRRGPLQFLLLPTSRVTGIESPEILESTSVNYFARAWQARSYMVERYKAPISDFDVSLALNSKRTRSQNQLHIHISCLRADLKKVLQQNAAEIKAQWAPLLPSSGGLLNHPYWARRISVSELTERNAFQILAEIPEAKSNMGNFGLALVAVPSESPTQEFVLLTEQGHIEEIQDHECRQLFPTKPAVK